MESNEIENKYWSWEKNLWNSYDEIFIDALYTTKDGVISPCQYYNAPFKILFINKEGYDEDVSNLNQTLKEQLENNQPIFPSSHMLVKHLKQYMFVLSLFYNGCCNLLEEDVLNLYSKWDDSSFRREFLKVAYINVRKSDGIKKSNSSTLRQYVHASHDILERQIAYFNPSIILGGNVSDNIFDKEFDWSENLYERLHVINIYQIRIGNRLFPFVDMFHPSYPGIGQNYFMELFHALQTVGKKYPNFWENRLNQDCFNE